MFEVERKFHLTADEKERLLNGAQFIGEKQFVDIYYDTADYRLTRKDWWLRSRAGKWELKMRLRASADAATTQYDEKDKEPDIRKALNFPSNGTLEEMLRQYGYTPFCICTTTRRHYEKDIFGIDLDEATYEGTDFTYTITEIERTVEDPLQTEQAAAEILAFAHQHGLSLPSVRGKILEYLRRIRPEHYQALVESGTVKDF